MGNHTAETFEPKIYVACLAAYNNGILYGRWIDADQDADAIRDDIAEMLEASPVADAEEYAIHDFEDFAGMHVEEYTGIDQVAELARFAVKHGKLGAALFEHYGDLDAAREALEDSYCGVYPSLAEYMEELTTETTAIPDNLRHYIDWEIMARDAEVNGDLFAIRLAWGEVHVFWAR